MKAIQRINGLLAILLVSILPVYGQDLSTNANQFLQTLSEDLKIRATYSFDNEERFNFHFIPKSRNGLPLKDMNGAQRQAAFSLLKASLSDQGYKKATGILELESILREVEGRGPDDTYRDPGKYYFTVFGTPAKDKPWGWRLEGHHISLNFSSVSGAIESSTPSFFGTNPAIVPRGPEKGKEVLKLESDLGFALVNSLSGEQLTKGLISKTAPTDIITGNDRHARLLDPQGLPYTSLTNPQKKIFLELLDVYVKNYSFGFSSRLMDKIRKAGIDNLHFAWAGSMKPGAGHYYRIQGPMLLIEFDNTQNNSNHVHTIVRDLTNDFAEDILREHYLKEHGK